MGSDTIYSEKIVSDPITATPLLLDLVFAGTCVGAP